MASIANDGAGTKSYRCVNLPASYWSFTESSLCLQPKPQPWTSWQQIEHGCCGLEGSSLLNGMGPLGQPHRDGLLPQDGILFGRS